MSRKRVQLEERDGVVGKECTKCGEWKSIIDGFHKDKNCLGGRSPRCKQCAIKHVKTYYEENRENKKSYATNYYYENHEKVLAYWNDFRRKNPTRSKDWYMKNREHAIEYSKRYRRNNHVIILKKEWYYRENNKEKRNDYNKKYAKLNLCKFRIYNALRRARKQSLLDDWSDEQKKSTWQFFGNACALTETTDNIHADHAIPLSIGHGGTIHGNMYPLCEKLNISKNNRNIFEWFKANKQHFNLEQERFDRLIEWLAKANGMTVQEYRDYVYWCHANPRSLEELKEAK
jgi:hypothetical protein